MNADEIVRALLAECEDCSERDGQGGCRSVIYCPNRDAAAKITELNNFEQSQCAILLAQLTASQARERAAVEDMREANFCSQCRLFVAHRCDGMHKRGKCCDWEWRGTQAGEE